MKRKRTNKRPLGWFNRFALFITFFCGACLLFSYTAAYIDPKTFWYPAFFGLAYPFILLANFLILLYWLMVRRWQALLPLFFILCGYNLLTRNIGFRFPVEGISAKERSNSKNMLRIMTYNIHQFTQFDFAPKRDINIRNQFLDVLHQQMPDIACFQEFHAMKKGKFANIDSVKKTIKTPYYKLKKTFENEFEVAGLAIFSKYPIKNSGELHFPEPQEDGLWADIDFKGKIIRVFCIHMQSVHMEQEDYQFLEEVKKTDANPVNIKPGSPSRRIGGRLKNAFIKRSEQAQIVREATKNSPHPFIVVGDFNDTPASFAMHTIAVGTKDTFQEKGSGFVRTYNGAFPNFQIDYILASEKDFDVLSYDVLTHKLSDHYPVRSDLRLK